MTTPPKTTTTRNTGPATLMQLVAVSTTFLTVSMSALLNFVLSERSRFWKHASISGPAVTAYVTLGRGCVSALAKSDSSFAIFACSSPFSFIHSSLSFFHLPLCLPLLSLCLPLVPLFLPCFPLLPPLFPLGPPLFPIFRQFSPFVCKQPVSMIKSFPNR